MLAFITGLKAEARLLAPLNARVFVGGGTVQGANDAARRAIEAGATSLVSFGLAGGLNPALQPGAILVPTRILVRGRLVSTDEALSDALGGFTISDLLSSDTVVASVAGKAERWADMHADAVDMESGAVAEAARKAELPCAALRAICDPATRALPPAAVAALGRGGSISLPGLIGSLILRPGQISDLRELSRDAKAARTALITHLAGLRDRADLRRMITRASSSF